VLKIARQLMDACTARASQETTFTHKTPDFRSSSWHIAGATIHRVLAEIREHYSKMWLVEDGRRVFLRLI
jgi:hypothetical protein